ncbi:roadblock/LC7 domain-containing protein [filamentous cyanobacterium LEGE 11480]|uniref:Roadblock/LC7 domain-containing protein n=1 Tax=Romeriopsis navalis LEGE 11480 TaxID=2777977 RepID=A0A928VQM0_9CYAN|nr:roadblock/LC7 domain-containing protein [Romeriopsis navalis]MBE9030314.1 roadblock/LC7 domain-containing protein [Romeriopsis navalis LEGE 11480]
MTIDLAKLNSVLANFVSSSLEIQGAAVVTPDGLPLASNLSANLDEERVAAMSAAILSLGETIGTELSRGGIAKISVEGDNGYAILTSCGEDAVFLVLADKASKQGVLMLQVKQALAVVKSCVTAELHAVA